MALQNVKGGSAGGKGKERRVTRAEAKAGARKVRREADKGAGRCTGGCGLLVEDCECPIDEDGQP